MKLKTLLLSSAAVFTVVGSAQAADLMVAEPVDYVQVCDAFGTGYWYIPGTTTCLRIGGQVTFDINIHDSKNVMSGGLALITNIWAPAPVIRAISMTAPRTRVPTIRPVGIS